MVQPHRPLKQVVGSRRPSIDELARCHNASLFPDLWEMANIPGNEVMRSRCLGAFEELIIVRVACRRYAGCPTMRGFRRVSMMPLALSVLTSTIASSECVRLTALLPQQIEWEPPTPRKRLRDFLTPSRSFHFIDFSADPDVLSPQIIRRIILFRPGASKTHSLYDRRFS